VFERFTERSRQVVVLAQEEARALRHNYIGTEHILLGLLREEEGLAARVLQSLDITLERARDAARVRRGPELCPRADTQRLGRVSRGRSSLPIGERYSSEALRERKPP